MNLTTKDINELRAHISYYLNGLYEGIKADKRKFKVIEYINLFFLDIITSFYYQLEHEQRMRFLHNLQMIVDGLYQNNKKDLNHDKQIQNNT